MNELYTLFYVLFSACIIYPPVEFISAGFTVSHIFGNFIGSENESFVQHHIKRIVVTMFVHSCLPLGYMLGLYVNDPNSMPGLLWNASEDPFKFIWYLIFTSSVICPLLAIYKIVEWSRENWLDHPVCKNLNKFCDPTTNWITVAANINQEFKRVDKICLQTNAWSKVAVLENWIIKVSLYTVHFSHQSDSTLELNKTDAHSISLINGDETQFINIEVKSSRNGVQAFDIRLNAFDFKDVQEKVARPINILPNIKFHKSVLDRFIDVFKEEIQANPKYTINEDLELCIGCMQARSNVKLVKRCSSEGERAAAASGTRPCTSCFCRPMWCWECMARWFASRQEHAESPSPLWLANKCTCPVCRSVFCILDVAPIQVPLQ